MADVLTSNLYPPIIDTFMPAFVNNSCKIYFELSDFNTIADIDIDLVQVSVRNQKNNENSLVNANGIRYYTLHQENNKYYIEILNTDLVEGFGLNLYHKVQIRFTNGNWRTLYPAEVNNYYITSTDNPNLTWINQHLDLFSEWSTVCLIRRITEPQIEQNSLVFPTGSDHYEYETPFLRFNGKVQFGLNEEEYLKEYRLRLYSTTDESPYNDGELIEDSGIQYPDRDIDVNKLLYNFNAKLQGDNRYNLYVDIVTNNLYQKTTSYIGILTAFDSAGAATLTLTCTEDPDQGRIKLDIEDDIASTPADYIIISRTSNRSNFTSYDEIAVLQYSTSIDYYDESIESGIWYKYAVQKYKLVETNNRLVPYYTAPTESDPIMTIYEDVFLNSQGKQLKLRYDSRITSYKKTVTENKVETLGSPYPIVRRNSATNYKQFSFNGLITFHTDEANIFTSENELYGGEENATKYNNYNIDHRIDPYNDYIKEREFREKVIDFLNSGKVFLFRTITEGLILARLMDINITPNQNLNNYICNFTATVIEIAKCTPENYYKYKIFPHLYSTIQLER